VECFGKNPDWYLYIIAKLDEEHVILQQFDTKTNNIIHEIHITENEIIDVIQKISGDNWRVGMCHPF
jgi:hypothetical protein